VSARTARRLLSLQKNSNMTTLAKPSVTFSNNRPYFLLAFGTFVWIVAYNIIQPLANWISFSLLGLAADSKFGTSLAFFCTMSLRSCFFSQGWSL
jgi:hypothetical protein